MADKHFEQHEAERTKQERKQKDYENSLTEINTEKSTHKNGTPQVENQHHGRKAAGEGRKK